MRSCKDCRWYLPKKYKNDTDNFSRCKYPNRIKRIYKRDYTDGSITIEPNHDHICRKYRLDQEKCGTRGRWFRWEPVALKAYRERIAAKKLNKS